MARWELENLAVFPDPRHQSSIELYRCHVLYLSVRVDYAFPFRHGFIWSFDLLQHIFTEFQTIFIGGQKKDLISPTHLGSQWVVVSVARVCDTTHFFHKCRRFRSIEIIFDPLLRMYSTEVYILYRGRPTFKDL